MDNFLFLSILLSISAFTEGHLEEETVDDGSGRGTFSNSTSDDSFPHTAVSSSVGSVVAIILLAIIIYYCCCRNKTPEGFTQFNNENDGHSRGRSRSRRRRFFGRNRRHNSDRNNPEPVHSPPPTQVIIRPVVNIGMPPGDQNSGVPVGESGGFSSMPTAPPAYNESMNNPHMPSNFNIPPMPNQFVNPPMPSQFFNPPMPGNFNNPPPMPGNFNNPPPMPGNFNNPPPMPGNFNNPPPVPGNFNNPPPVPGNFNELPPKNPNSSSYYKY